MAVWPNGTKTRPSISSNYGPRPSIDTNGDGRPDTSTFHSGTDFVGFEEIRAVEAGTVIIAGPNGSNGNEVAIQHANGAITRYWHMEPDLRVRKGQRVVEGQHIGDKGATGLATGEHLHFRVDFPLGTHHDPLAYMAGRLASVPAAPAPASGSAALTAADVAGWSYRKVQGDGLVYWEPTGELARRIQQGMANLGIYHDLVDGIWGPNTRKAIQTLAREGGYSGPLDGLIGVNTIKGLQNGRARKGGYTGPADGVPAEYTWNGVRKGLGQ